VLPALTARGVPAAAATEMTRVNMRRMLTPAAPSPGRPRASPVASAAAGSQHLEWQGGGKERRGRFEALVADAAAVAAGAPWWERGCPCCPIAAMRPASLPPNQPGTPRPRPWVVAQRL
jgi:hypothetical protein